MQADVCDAGRAAKVKSMSSVEASLHQALRMFDGRSFKSRVARCNMSIAPAAYMLNQYASCSDVLSLITSVLETRLATNFTQSECIRIVGSVPHALAMLSNGGILPLMFHIKFAITGRRARRRLDAHRIE